MNPRQGEGDLIVENAHRIEHDGMVVQGKDQHRLIGTVAVKDPAVREGLFLQAAAVQVIGCDHAALFGLPAEDLAHLLVIPGGREVHIAELQSHPDHLEMIVDKAGQNRAALGINGLHRAGDILRPAVSHAQTGNLTVMGQQPVGTPAPVHTEDLSVFNEKVSLIHDICSYLRGGRRAGLSRKHLDAPDGVFKVLKPLQKQRRPGGRSHLWGGTRPSLLPYPQTDSFYGSV